MCPCIYIYNIGDEIRTCVGMVLSLWCEIKLSIFDVRFDEECMYVFCIVYACVFHEFGKWRAQDKFYRCSSHKNKEKDEKKKKLKRNEKISKI